MQLKYRRAMLWALSMAAAGAMLACGGDGKQASGSSPEAATLTPGTQAPAKGTTVSTSFEQFGVGDAKVVGRPLPDPAKFATKFALKDDVGAYFKLASSGAGVRSAWVETVLSYNGLTLRRDVEPITQGAWGLTPLRLTLPGDYQVQFSILGTKETKTTKFTIEGQPPAAARFLDASIVHSTGQYCCTVLGQPGAASFPASDSQIAAVFHTEPNNQPLTAQWKYQGQAIGEPQFIISDVRPESDRGQYIPFYDSYSSSRTSGFSGVFSRVQHPAGDYELVLTLLPGGETRSLKFTLTSPTADPSKAKLDQFSVSAQAKGTPATNFDAFGSVSPACTKGAGFVDADTLTVVWKYQGAVVGNSWGGTGALAGTGAIPLPTGEYEATCFVLGFAGEKSIKFTVSTDGLRPATPTTTPSPAPRVATPALPAATPVR